MFSSYYLDNSIIILDFVRCLADPLNSVSVIVWVMKMDETRLPVDTRHRSTSPVRPFTGHWILEVKHKVTTETTNKQINKDLAPNTMEVDKITPSRVLSLTGDIIYSEADSSLPGYAFLR